MKKLLLATAVSAVALTGCQSAGFQKAKDKVTSPFKKDSTEQVAENTDRPEPPKDGKRPHGKPPKDGKKPPHHGFNPHHAHEYSCESDASVKAVYNPHEETAKVTITAPTWKLDNQTINMKLSPSASGNLYINDKNANSVYQWHTKNEIGVLSVTLNGKTHDINCEGKPMPKDHPEMPEE